MHGRNTGMVKSVCYYSELSLFEKMVQGGAVPRPPLLIIPASTESILFIRAGSSQAAAIVRTPQGMANAQRALPKTQNLLHYGELVRIDSSSLDYGFVPLIITLEVS